MTEQDTYELDAANLDTAGTLVPTDLPGNDGYALGTSKAKTWGVKIVNGSDQPVDATPILSTSDDRTLTEYDTVDSETVTVSSGSPPNNVELVDADVVGGVLGVQLTPAAAATGTVTVHFIDREV